VSAVFKNVSFADLPLCTICGESDITSECPNIRPSVEPEVTSTKPRTYSRERSYSRDRDNNSSQGYDSRSSYSLKRNQNRSQSHSPSPYRGRSRERNYSDILIKISDASLSHLADIKVTDTVPSQGTGTILVS
jgi:hypothetical protein